jgi:hypothetical protein
MDGRTHQSTGATFGAFIHVSFLYFPDFSQANDTWRVLSGLGIGAVFDHFHSVLLTWLSILVFDFGYYTTSIRAFSLGRETMFSSDKWHCTASQSIRSQLFILILGITYICTFTHDFCLVAPSLLCLCTRISSHVSVVGRSLTHIVTTAVPFPLIPLTVSPVTDAEQILAHSRQQIPHILSFHVFLESNAFQRRTPVEVL